MIKFIIYTTFRDTDKVTEWNKTLTEAKVLKTINSEVAITYQVSKELNIFKALGRKPRLITDLTASGANIPNQISEHIFNT